MPERLPARATAPTAATPAVAATEAAAVASTTTLAAAAAGAARSPLFLRASVIDIEGSPVDLGAIECRLGRFRLLGTGHLHKGETLGPAGVTLGTE